ncbi:hypothetical protein ACFVJS_23030, partial [Nocardioides sp. NPDC057772]|uniref:hypothetical protein n=1 Tax=Nocardioides sp. NPDC057772 TaxID=3346245 RepID=UPI00366DD661
MSALIHTRPDGKAGEQQEGAEDRDADPYFHEYAACRHRAKKAHLANQSPHQGLDDVADHLLGLLRGDEAGPDERGQALERASLYYAKQHHAHLLQSALLPHTLPRQPGLRVGA